MEDVVLTEMLKNILLEIVYWLIGLTNWNSCSHKGIVAFHLSYCPILLAVILFLTQKLATVHKNLP